jgi:hypothetical protein
MRPMHRAKLPTQVGDIIAKFKPHHVDLYCSELNEVSQDIIEGLVGKASMAKSAVIDNSKARAIMDDNDKKRRAIDDNKKVTNGPTVASPSVSVSRSSSSADQNDEHNETLKKLESLKLNGVLTEEEYELKKQQIISENSQKSAPPKRTASTTSYALNTSSSSGSGIKGDSLAAMRRAKSKQINFSNPDSIDEALKDVRNDQTPTDWALLGYANMAQTKEMDIELVGSGTGGVEELKQHLRDDNIFYGIVRLTDDIDTGIGVVSAVKFAFIHFMGNDIKPLARARVTTHKSPVSEVFQPYHVETFASKSDELTQQQLSELVGSASMTKSNVIDNDKARIIMEDNESKRRQLDTKNIV